MKHIAGGVVSAVILCIVAGCSQQSLCRDMKNFMLLMEPVRTSRNV